MKNKYFCTLPNLLHLTTRSVPKPSGTNRRPSSSGFSNKECFPKTYVRPKNLIFCPKSFIFDFNPPLLQSPKLNHFYVLKLNQFLLKIYSFLAKKQTSSLKNRFLDQKVMTLSVFMMLNPLTLLANSCVSGLLEIMTKLFLQRCPMVSIVAPRPHLELL